MEWITNTFLHSFITFVYLFLGIWMGMRIERKKHNKPPQKRNT